MTGNLGKSLVIAAACVGAALYVYWRGYFDVPLYGRISRENHAASLKIICVLILLLGAAFATAAAILG